MGLCALMAALLLCPVVPKAASEAKPIAPYIDEGACPFECCTYRHWTVEKDTSVVDKPEGVKVVGTLHKGDGVEALDGQVWSWPVIVHAAHAIEATPIKKDDSFYVLHYVGEDEWKIWFNGQVYETNADEINSAQVKTEWWVKLQTADGSVGWALSTPDGNFSNQDSCG